MLKKLAALMAKRPMRIFLLALLVIIVLATGVRNVDMATGNETLVSSDSKVYKENHQLEEDFGGESIIVVYESTSQEKLLTVDRLNHMKGLEETLHVQEGIYSIISPVTLVEQMSSKQAENYREGLEDVADGLGEMGGKLVEISGKLDGNTAGSSQMAGLDGSLSELTGAIGKMVNGQEKLKSGTTQIINGYSDIGVQTKKAAEMIGITASQMDNEDPQQRQQAEQLKNASIQLLQIAEKMHQTAEKSASLPNVSEQTITGLKKIEGGLLNQQGQLAGLQEEKDKQKQDLIELGSGLKEMGESLEEISENLTTMNKYSDTLKPGLPASQETLNHMIYEENGSLRTIFDELVIDEDTMIMIVKFEGNVEDSVKSEAVAAIKEYLDDNHLESTRTMVSGKPVLDDAIRSSMKESMQKMMLLSVLFMIIILSLTFKVSWRLLSLGIILLAVIGTVGLMGLLDIPITMVSMAVFPILIGLGIDYAIQFHSRYSEEIAEEDEIHEQ